MTIQTRRFLFCLGALALGLVVLGIYYGGRVCADIEIASLSAPNTFGAKEARRKLAALKAAITNEQQGYVRLSEGELNSYLAESVDRIGPMPLGWRSPKPLPPGELNLGRCRVDLLKDQLTIYNWLVFPFAGHDFKLVWARTGEIHRQGEKWTFVTRSMRVGEVNVPPKFQSKIQEMLGGTDTALAKEIQFLVSVPTLEILPNELSKKAEIRLYSYPESSVVARMGH